MKKLLALSVCVLYILAFSVPVAAAGIALSASATDIKVGDTVTLTVSVSGADAAKSGGIAVSYNSNKFELVSGKWLLSNATMTAFDPANAKAAVLFSEATDMNGDIFTVTLRAISPTKTAETVSVMVDLRDGAAEVYKGTAERSIAVAVGEEPADDLRPSETTQPTASPAAGGIQGTVNPPQPEAVETTAPTTGDANEESTVGFPWYIAVIVAAAVGIPLIFLRRRKG